MSLNYCTYDDYLLALDNDTGEFYIKYNSEIITEKLCLKHKEQILTVVECANKNQLTNNSLAVTYSLGDRKFGVVFEVSRNGVLIKKDDNINVLVLSGDTNCSSDCIAMSTLQSENKIRSSIGHTCSAKDNMLFYKQEDKALVVDGVFNKRFEFNNNKKLYEICTEIKDSVRISIAENVYANKFDISYKPINKNSTFKNPPVGWMTWYAVKFDAGETPKGRLKS